MTLSAERKRVWKEYLSDDEYDALVEISNGLCYICKQPEIIDGRSLAIDLDHHTGAVRGLLCTRCNRRLGGASEQRWLRMAAVYLENSDRRFADFCPQCDEIYGKSVVVMPGRIVKTDGKHTTYDYVCPSGHRHKCSWRTIGLKSYPSPSWEPVIVPQPSPEK